MEEFVKDPSAKLDYFIDWSAWLDGDTITASQWIVPSGLVKETDSFTGTGVTVWLSGGKLGTEYTVTNRITTAAGRVEERSFRLRVVNR